MIFVILYQFVFWGRWEKADYVVIFFSPRIRIRRVFVRAVVGIHIKFILSPDFFLLFSRTFRPPPASLGVAFNHCFEFPPNLSHHVLFLHLFLVDNLFGW